MLAPLSTSTTAMAASAGLVPASMFAFLTPNKKSWAFNKSYLLAAVATLVLALKLKEPLLPFPAFVTIMITPFAPLDP